MIQLNVIKKYNKLFQDKDKTSRINHTKSLKQRIIIEGDDIETELKESNDHILKNMQFDKKQTQINNIKQVCKSIIRDSNSKNVRN